MQRRGVDIVRLSADSEQVFAQLPLFRQQLITPRNYPLDGIQQCNGYWHRIAGMSVA